MKEEIKMYDSRASERSIVREKAIHYYVTALDEGDLEGVAIILDEALDDPELEQAIAEINLAYQEEEGIQPIADDAELVRNLLQKHLTTAFTPSSTAEEALRIEDVAEQLQHEAKISSNDHAAIAKLLNCEAPLPSTLGMPAIKALSNELSVEASDRFWQLFRQKAIFMRMGRSHKKVSDGTQLAAAREAVAQRNAKSKKKPKS
jgi:DNA-binding phage protein